MSTVPSQKRKLNSLATDSLLSSSSSSHKISKQSPPRFDLYRKQLLHSLPSFEYMKELILNCQQKLKWIMNQGHSISLSAATTADKSATTTTVLAPSSSSLSSSASSSLHGYNKEAQDILSRFSFVQRRFYLFEDVVLFRAITWFR